MQSVLLLPTTSEKLNVTGLPQRGAGYNNSIGNNHTVSFNLYNFVGRIYIEGSLASEPQECDWFAIPLIPNNDFIQYPLVPYNPSSNMQGDSGNFSYNFTGNYIWIRARVCRKYIQPPVTDPTLVGTVLGILMNYGAVASGNANVTNIVGVQGPIGPTGPSSSQLGPTGPTGPGLPIPNFFLLMGAD